MMTTLSNKLVIIAFAIIVSGTIYAGCNCKKVPEPKSYGSLSVSSGCPCLDGNFMLNKALSSKSSVNSCVSRYDFSQITGLNIKFTSQDYGETFSCFYQNYVTKEYQEVVEYGARDEIVSYHKACDQVIRDLARYYKKPCKK